MRKQLLNLQPRKTRLSKTREIQLFCEHTIVAIGCFVKFLICGTVYYFIFIKKMLAQARLGI